MLTINNILREVKEVPIDRLEELHQFIHSLIPKVQQAERRRKKILSFGGAFKDMPEKDYVDFVERTKKTRRSLFDRDIRL